MEKSTNDPVWEKFKGNVIDCSIIPFSPYGLTVLKHRQGGQVKFNPAQVKLWFAQAQQSYLLHKELEGKHVLSASVLDWLLVNQEYILKEWDGVAFLGTIYRDKIGLLHVRYLRRRFFFFGAWCSGSRLIGGLWDKKHPVAILSPEAVPKPKLYLVP